MSHSTVADRDAGCGASIAASNRSANFFIPTIGVGFELLVIRKIEPDRQRFKLRLPS